MLQKFSNILIYSVAVFAPLGFTAVTLQGLMFDKVFFLVAVTVILALIFVWRAVSRRELVLPATPFDLPMLALLLIFALSSFFAINPAVSFLGAFGRPALSFMGALAGGLFLVFSLKALVKKNANQTLILVLLGSTGLATIFSVLQSYGVHILALTPFLDNTVGTLGSPLAAAVTAAALLPVAVNFLNDPRRRWLGLVLAVIFGATLWLFNFSVAWLVGLIGLSFLFLVTVARVERSRLGLGVLGVLIALSIFALVGRGFPVNFGVGPSIPAFVNLSHQTSWDLTRSALMQNFALGVGPGNFEAVYMKNRPELLNNTVAWQVRFQEPASTGWELAITTGALGLLATLAGLLALLWIGFKVLKRSGEAGFDANILGLLAGLVAWIAAGLLTALNASQLIIGLVVLTAFTLAARAVWPEIFKERHLKITLGQKPSWLYGLATLGGIALAVAGVSFLMRVFVADIKAAEAVKMSDADFGVAELIEASNLVPWREQYLANLSDRALAALQAEAAQEKPDTQVMQRYMGQAVQAATALTQRSPVNALNWQTHGGVYEFLANYVSNPADALNTARQSYEKAGVIEPTNPTWLLNIARTWRLAFKLPKDADPEALNKAEAALNAAKKMKNNWSAIYLEEAFLNESAEKLDDAVISARQAYRLDNSVANGFQYGRLLFNQALTGKSGVGPSWDGLPRGERSELYGEAEEVMLDLLAASPSYANARYILASIYEQQDKFAEAKAQYDTLLNQLTDAASRKQVEARLAALESKRRPAPEPIEETGLEPAPEVSEKTELP